MVTSDDEPAPAATPWWREVMVWANTYQSWIYPVLIGVLYLVGRVSADRAYRAYGLSTQDVGFGVEDGITALVFLLVLVSLAVFLGRMLFAAVVGLWGTLAKRDWRGAGPFLFVLGLGVTAWVYAGRHLEQQTALACSVAVVLAFLFCISAVLAAKDQPTRENKRLVGRIATVMVMLISLVSVPFETNWRDLPHERTTTTSGGWPSFLVLAPHPRAFTLHTREGVTGLADGACVYSFGAHEGFTVVWGPVGSTTGNGRLVSTGIDQLTAGCS